MHRLRDLGIVVGHVAARKEGPDPFPLAPQKKRVALQPGEVEIGNRGPHGSRKPFVVIRWDPQLLAHLSRAQVRQGKELRGIRPCRDPELAVFQDPQLPARRLPIPFILIILCNPVLNRLPVHKLTSCFKGC